MQNAECKLKNTKYKIGVEKTNFDFNRKKKDGFLFSPSGGNVKFVTYINDTRKLNMSDV